jgi:dihydroflavonol-4-reductase
MDRTVAITGATGFVGRAVVERLLSEPDLALRCLVRQQSDTAFLDGAGPRVSLVRGDVTDPGSLSELVEGAWGVVNLAGTRDFWSRSRRDYYALNERGAENVFHAALEADCEKVVQVSTPLAFGMPERSPFDETSSPGPHASDYARSKYRGDQAGWRLHRAEGLPLTVVHLAAVIGAGDPRPTMEIRRAAEGRLPVLVGAEATFTYLYLNDAAEAIGRALLHDGTVGRSYLIGAERATTREYFGMIGELAGVSIPSLNVPESYVLPLARALEQVARWTGVRSPIPVDVLETSAAGSLLFEAKRSERELGMAYTPLRLALSEAVEEIRKTPSKRSYRAR